MKHHTVIFVPHARAKFRKWRFTSLQAGLAVTALLVLSAVGVIATFLLINNSVDHRQLESISEENRSLREVNQTFETSIKDLESQLNDYQDRIHKLAIVAGLAELSPNAEAGIGGGDPREEGIHLNADLRVLRDQAEELGLGMSLLQQRFDERRLMISATPAITPVQGILTSGFGNRIDPFTRRKAFHRGVDYIAPPGQNVVASADGLVTRAGRAEGLGIAVFLSHGYGVTTRYGHLSRVNAKAGQKVRRGDVIGYVGNTGRATGYHLHYEVHVDGKPTNPLGYILSDAAP